MPPGHLVGECQVGVLDRHDLQIWDPRHFFDQGFAEPAGSRDTKTGHGWMTLFTKPGGRSSAAWKASVTWSSDQWWVWSVGRSRGRARSASKAARSAPT